ncbi:MAG TPA: cellulase family glycosylhydrolase, partial [Verrucomicrobiae bacterium]|nr:cellulase family glycosylhydrolase [Verrucomicrobiae bacterium]
MAQIESATILTAHPSQFNRVDFVIMLTASWTNSPYRAEEVRLDFDLISPSGKPVVVPAYYERGKSGSLSVWKVRFTPEETGEYRGEFVLTNGANHSVSSNLSFTVASSHQKGFLHLANDWTFRFDDGEPFRGIGENIGWESRSRDDSRFFRNLNESPRYNYEYMLGRLAADGGNFFRTWMCPWNLPLEWKTVSNTNRYSDDTGYFNASAIRRMDRLVNLAGSLDVYMMLTLDNSGDFQGWAWRYNSYNQENGGPVTKPQDFFTDPQAKAQYKDRLRYLVARWGYSPHIAAWEFFNEIDNLMYGLPQRIPDDVITSWHKEMSEYLKRIDPYHHLVTTSVSHRHVAGLYRIPTMDFNQIHIYGHNGQSRAESFPEVLRDNSHRYGKPFVIGEFGFEWDWSKNFDDFAPEMDSDFK